MLFPIIKVKEKIGEEEYTHIVGTNSHDRLFIENNAIHYLNAQDLSSTRCSAECRMLRPEECNLSFDGVLSDYSISGHPEIEFVTLEELIRIATETMKEQTEATINTYEMIQKYLDEQARCEKKLSDCKKKTGIQSDTSGNLF